MTKFTVEYKEFKHPATGQDRKGFAVLENGKLFQTVVYATKEEAEKHADFLRLIRKVSS